MNILSYLREMCNGSGNAENVKVYKWQGKENSPLGRQSRGWLSAYTLGTNVDCSVGLIDPRRSGKSPTGKVEA